MTKNFVPGPRMKVPKIGTMFGDLKLVELIGRGKCGRLVANFKCRCGNYKTMAVSLARIGHDRSCGCFKKNRFKKHGLSVSEWPTYSTWMSMRQRCNNPNCNEYKHYGARGIKICKRWDRFENFFSDMGRKPDGMSIERKDNNRNYTPSNCKWANHKEQMNNTRSTRMITIGGITKPQTQWAEFYGIRAGLVRNRICAGWSEEDALKTPTGKYAKKT